MPSKPAKHTERRIVQPCTSEGRIEHVEKEVGTVHKDVGAIKQVLFNGIRDASKAQADWLRKEAPKLATTAQVKLMLDDRDKIHKRLADAREKGRDEVMRKLGKIRDKKARQNTALLAGLVTLGVALVENADKIFALLPGGG